MSFFQLSTDQYQWGAITILAVGTIFHIHSGYDTKIRSLANQRALIEIIDTQKEFMKSTSKMHLQALKVNQMMFSALKDFTDASLPAIEGTTEVGKLDGVGWIEDDPSKFVNKNTHTINGVPSVVDDSEVKVGNDNKETN